MTRRPHRHARGHRFEPIEALELIEALRRTGHRPRRLTANLWIAICPACRRRGDERLIEIHINGVPIERVRHVGAR